MSSYNHPANPEQIHLEGMEVFDAGPRFNPNQRRAFGSIPGLMGKDMDIPEREIIGKVAFSRVQPEVLRGELYGATDGTSVNGLLLNADEYNLIVRSDRAFGTAIQSRTGAANRNTPVPEKYRRQTRSAHAAFTSKLEGYEGALQGFASERERLQTLLEWQRTPGYAKTDETTMRLLANDAFSGSFINIINTIADHRQLDQSERHKTVMAMSRRLFKGPQREKIGYWGDMLDLALRYNRAKTMMFVQSQRRIQRQTGTLALQLHDHDPLA